MGQIIDPNSKTGRMLEEIELNAGRPECDGHKAPRYNFEIKTLQDFFDLLARISEDKSRWKEENGE